MAWTRIRLTPGAILPARELDGELLAVIGRPAGAEAAYHGNLARGPGRRPL